ncbi:type VII secretion protein EssC [Cohnella cholangitidis]|uniref:type VII secretion protein EssC n=1 Tax=Cohnella cholangitidis TaxID=2598458 RepID=UPI001E623DF7|nr:type VII secretion protein EssC [Cohnella cholangitidis]
MQLSLLKENELFTCVLPEKQKGQYWVTHTNAQGFEERVISAEGVEGKWILKSNKNAIIQDRGHQRVKELVLEAPCFYSLILKKTNETIWLYSEPISEDRKTFEKLILPTQGEMVIGRADNCDIHFANKYASSRHAEILIAGSTLTIQDLNSSNGTFVNGIRVQNKTLKPGDIIYIIGLKILVGQGFIAINNPDGQMSYKQSVLRPLVKQAAIPADDEDGDDEDVSVSTPFYRSPRFKKDIASKEIKIDPPPSLGNQEQTPLMLMLGPSLTMGMSAVFMGIFSLQNAMSSTGSVKSAMPTLVMSFSMLIGTILWPILTRKHEKRKRIQREKLRQEKYRAYIDRMSQEIANECVRQSQILHENHVTVDKCVERIKLRQRNLWERSHGHNDFLKVRLGLGQLPLQADIKYPERRFTLDDDDLQDALYKLAEQPKVLEQVPVTLSLMEDWNSGFIGNRTSITDLIKGIILQLVALHSYDELKLVFIYDKKEQDVWDFAKWLPHIWNREQGIRFLATSASEVKELAAFFEKEIARREAISNDEELAEISPHYVVFALNKSLAAKAEMINSILKHKKNYGFSVVYLYDELKQLPKECSMVVEFGGGISKIYDKDDITGKHIAFQPDFYYKHNEHDLAVILANTELDSASSSYVLPNMLTFLEMFEVGKIEHLNALTRWKENDPTVTLETPIGVDTTGEKFKLDLHEKFHGPHGLIAGMTGSGKSEFIMTFILSLAVNYHPYEVAFILIDYKGGGMANAFANLPHLAGTITNLDGAAVKRSLISIQSELKRRQAIFSDTSKQVNISNIDIYKYQKLYREGQVTEPLQHLFIISDEFAELKTQQPEFMEQLVSAARIGRSLGVHLILATQKPSGVVDDQIWSNSKFRICLKVQEKADSMDVIKRPDAAELSVTGRYFVQVGFNELFDLGQSAWGGAPYYPADRIEKHRDESIAVVDNLGRITKQAKSDKRRAMFRNPPKQIDEINKYLSAIAEEENIQVRPLWLEPIPDMIVVDELKEKYSFPDSTPFVLNPLIGEVDDPTTQRQFPMTFPLTREGNAIIYGSAGNGKTTFLTTLTYALIKNHTPAELNLYLLDFGSETLGVYAKAPHVGDVLLSHETEKINNFFKMLYREVESRKKRFSEYGGDYQSFIRASSDSEKLPSIVVFIHNYSAFAETYEDKEEAISYLTREGLKYGLYFILTASNTNAVRYRILQNFKQLYVLQLNDPTDYSSVLGNVEGLYPSKYKGRGIYKSDRVYEFQIAHVDRDSERMFDYLRNFSEERKREWQAPGATKIPILPDKVNVLELENEIKTRRETRVPIGVDKNSLKVAYYDFNQSYINLVLSQNNDNPSFIQGLAEVSAAKETSDIVVLDPDGHFRDGSSGMEYKYVSSLSELDDQIGRLFQTLVIRNNTYKEAIERGEQPPVFENLTCIISSLSSLMSRISEDSRDKLKVLFEKGETQYKVSFVLCDSVSSISAVAYENWFTRKASLSDAIWIGNGISEQYQLKIAKMTTDLYQEIGQDFGYLISKGKPALVKLLTSVTMESEVETDG